MNAYPSACPVPLIYVERRVLDAILANLADWIWSVPFTEKYITLGTSGYAFVPAIGSIAVSCRMQKIKRFRIHGSKHNLNFYSV